MRERGGKRESCKEIPRGCISPASEHINRSEPYSQSNGDENSREFTGGKGERAKLKRENVVNEDTRNSGNCSHVDLACENSAWLSLLLRRYMNIYEAKDITAISGFTGIGDKETSRQPAISRMRCT